MEDTGLDSSPRWTRERLVLSWKYAEKKREKGSSFNRIRWISREKRKNIFYFILFTSFEKFSLILDDSFVAGEWTKSLPCPCVDHQQGIFLRILSRSSLIIIPRKYEIIARKHLFRIYIFTNTWSKIEDFLNSDAFQPFDKIKSPRYGLYTIVACSRCFCHRIILSSRWFIASDGKRWFVRFPDSEPCQAPDTVLSI